MEVVLLVVLVGVQVERVLRERGGGHLVADDETDLRGDAELAQVEAGVDEIGDHARSCGEVLG